jgi:HSP20 family protein
MANVPVRSNGGEALARRNEWDPFNWARDLLRWDPFREMAPMPYTGEVFSPHFEVKENKDGFLFKADVPGVLEKDLEITRTGNRLTIGGKRESEHEDKGDRWYACERSYGSFSRVFTLPDGIDGENIRADLKDGVLTLFVPRKPEAQPQRIAVKPQEKKA